MQCFLYGKQCVEDDRHRDRCDCRSVETMEIQKNVLDVCAKRLSLCASDVAALSVQSRLMTCCDLVAEEAVYHRKCHTDFFASSVVKQVGRPVDVGKYEAFDKLCAWLEEGADELVTLAELSQKSASLTGNIDVYSEKWLKLKLVERYREHIVFAEVNGRKNVICWRNMASYICEQRMV